MRADEAAAPTAKGRSVRNGAGVGREKLGRLVVLELAGAGEAYSARGETAAPRCLTTLKCAGLSASSSDEFSAWGICLRWATEDDGNCTTGEKLPGARVGVPDVCDMVGGLCTEHRACYHSYSPALSCCRITLHKR